MSSRSKIVDDTKLGFIEKWANKTIGALLWRGSEHEFNSQSFHSFCDNQVIILTNKLIRITD